MLGEMEAEARTTNAAGRARHLGKVDDYRTAVLTAIASTGWLFSHLRENTMGALHASSLKRSARRSRKTSRNTTKIAYVAVWLAQKEPPPDEFLPAWVSREPRGEPQTRSSRSNYCVVTVTDAEVEMFPAAS